MILQRSIKNSMKRMSNITAFYKNFEILYEFLVFSGRANRDIMSCPFKWKNEPVNIAIMCSFTDSDLKPS
jgi:hypothetical protein